MSDIPPALKSLAPYLRLSRQFEARDLTVSYFFQMYFVQNGIKLGKDEVTKRFLLGVMDKMEAVKSQLISNGDEAVQNDIVASSHIENKALQLFNFADREDRNSNFDVKVIKTFYTASLLFEILTLFGELNEESAHHKKYAQWKATYLEKCRQTGEQPVAGPALHDQELAEEAGPSYSGTLPPGQEGGFPVPQPSPAQPCPPQPAQPYQPPQPAQSYPPPQPAQSYQPPQPTQSYPTPASQTLPANLTAPRAASVAVGDILNFDLSQHQNLDYHQIEKVQKFCRFASSALNYQDFPSCLDNLQKAINIVRTGREG